MEPIVVSTQAEYDEAQKLCRSSLEKSYFDIDKDIGMDIVGEVDYLVYNYLYQDMTKDETEKSLSTFYFNQEQASEITDYFLTHRPGDLYDIERGLNLLDLRPDGETGHETHIIIKDSTERIKVHYPVEVFGKSEVEVFGRSKVVAHDNAQITACDRSIVKAYNRAQVTALNQAYITARDNCAVYLFNQSTATIYNKATVTAIDKSKTALFNLADASLFNYAVANAYDESIVTGKDSTKIMAFNKAKVYAYDQAHVTAKDLSHTLAGGQASVVAEDDAVVIAINEAKVTAKHRALVFARDNAECGSADKALVVTAAQNKPLFLKSNILHILDRPYINWEPAVAVSLLISAADPKNKLAFEHRLKAMGCVDRESTNRVIASLVREFNRKLPGKRDQSESWER
jgi:hypothetical protein